MKSLILLLLLLLTEYNGYVNANNSYSNKNKYNEKFSSGNLIKLVVACLFFILIIAALGFRYYYEIELKKLNNQNNDTCNNQNNSTCNNNANPNGNEILPAYTESPVVTVTVDGNYHLPTYEEAISDSETNLNRNINTDSE